MTVLRCPECGQGPAECPYCGSTGGCVHDRSGLPAGWCAGCRCRLEAMDDDDEQEGALPEQ